MKRNINESYCTVKAIAAYAKQLVKNVSASQDE